MTFTLGAPGAAWSTRVRVNSPEAVEDAVLAVALGARAFDLPDAPWNEEARKRLENAFVLLGERKKELQPCEKDNVYWMRRSIAAARDLPAGHRVSESDLLWTRPLAGLAPGREAEVVGRTLDAPVKHGDAIPGSA